MRSLTLFRPFVDSLDLLRLHDFVVFEDKRLSTTLHDPWVPVVTSG